MIETCTFEMEFELNLKKSGSKIETDSVFEVDRFN